MILRISEYPDVKKKQYIARGLYASFIKSVLNESIKQSEVEMFKMRQIEAKKNFKFF